jgi:hypothetical protein
MVNITHFLAYTHLQGLLTKPREEAIVRENSSKKQSKEVTKPTIARGKNYLKEFLAPTHRCKTIKGEGGIPVRYKSSGFFADGEELQIENLPEHYAKFHNALLSYMQQDTDYHDLEYILISNRTKILFVYETLFYCGTGTSSSIISAWHEDPNNILSLLEKENASEVIQCYLRESILIYEYIKKLSKKPSKFRTREDITLDYPILCIDDTQEVMMVKIMHELKMRTYSVMETLYVLK